MRTSIQIQECTRLHVAGTHYTHCPRTHAAVSARGIGQLCRTGRETRPASATTTTRQWLVVVDAASQVLDSKPGSFRQRYIREEEDTKDSFLFPRRRKHRET
jgi:hypothetical protein